MDKENRKLKPGEKYLSVSLGGKGGLKFAVFKNKAKEKATEPDYVGNIPVALWINKKKAPATPEGECKVDKEEL